MNSPANSVIKFYFQNSSTIPSPVYGADTSSRPHSQDQLTTGVSPTLPLQFGMHYIRGSGGPERSTRADTIVNNDHALSVMNSAGTNNTQWDQNLCSKAVKFPTPDGLSLSLCHLPGTMGTIYSDADLVGSAQQDKHSFRNFIRSPNKWFRSLSSKAVPDDIYTIGSALIKDLNVITEDSPGLVSDCGFLVADQDDQTRVGSFNDSTEHEIGNPLALYPEYVAMFLTDFADFTGVDDNDDEEVEGYTGIPAVNDPPLIHVDSNSGEIQTPSMFHKLMAPVDGEDENDEENNTSLTLKGNSTLKRLTTKTKKILKQWSVHRSLPVDDEEKENQDPELKPPRRSLSLRDFGSISLRRSVSFRGWSRHKKEEEEAENWDYDADSDKDSVAGANLLCLFDAPEFKQRLAEGHVVERKRYGSDNEDNGSSFVTIAKTPVAADDDINIQVAQPASKVLRERKISINENYINVQQLPTIKDHRERKSVSGENFFSLLRAKTIRRAHSIREAARAARAAMQTYEAV